jgi:fructan beta-fructosidase
MPWRWPIPGPSWTAIYRERLRPQFHFSPARGWTNDPNGMVYYDGEYHLFFQHNPFGTSWGNMTWGHAVSTDMIHWRQLPDAIHMDELGTIFSGSGVVDHEEHHRLADGRTQADRGHLHVGGGNECRVAGQPFTQSIAYSTDRGRTFTKYEATRCSGTSWRQPRSEGHLARTDEAMGDGPVPRAAAVRLFRLARSEDLDQAERIGDPNGHECPDLFELPVDGDPENTRWVVWEAAGRYLIGTFDGKVFTPESEVLESCFGANDYAAQTFSDVPDEDGRRIQIAWMRGGRYPDMPFNQQMTVPRVLTLRTTPDGIRCSSSRSRS